MESYCNNREKRTRNLLYNQDGARRGVLGGMDEDGKGRHSHVSNILLASLIHRYAHCTVCTVQCTVIWKEEVGE